MKNVQVKNDYFFPGIFEGTAISLNFISLPIPDFSIKDFSVMNSTVKKKFL